MPRLSPLLLCALGGCFASARAQGPDAGGASVPGAGVGGDACLGPRSVDQPVKPTATNVRGTALTSCGGAPVTGWRRDGRCETGADDLGVHVVCAAVTEPFLRFTRARGNDLSTARGDFPGLQPGDRWCLCAARWREALEAGVAPAVDLEATDAKALQFVPRSALEAHALPPR